MPCSFVADVNHVLQIPETEQEVTTMFRKYEIVNKYVFAYNGRMYT